MLRSGGSQRLAGLARLVVMMLALGLVPSAVAAVATPRAGDWEGTGPHGLPLSFDLVRRHGRLVASNLTVGYGLSCPAVSRDAETVPLTHPSYSGPGVGRTSAGSFAVLSGREDGYALTVSGSFSSSRAGDFSLLTNGKLACWPKVSHWTVHPAHRRAVADGVWRGTITGPGFTASSLDVTVASDGRVMNGLSGSLTCTEDGAPAALSFGSVPAYEFIHANGSFASPLHAQGIDGVDTAWSATFGAHRTMHGSITIVDQCTDSAAHLTLHATAPRG